MTEYRFPYLNPHQSRTEEPTQWQLELAAAVEDVFSKGAKDLDSLVEGLNGSRVRPLGGGQWTADKFTALMRDLGA
jgi:hypothetical protein